MTDSSDGNDIDGSNSDGNPLGGGFDLSAILNKAKDMQAKMQDAQEAASKVRVKGNAGGGMVVAHADGRGMLVRLEIEDSLFSTGDKEMLEDLVVAAVNQAVQLGKEAMQNEMSQAAGGLPLPFDLSNLL